MGRLKGLKDLVFDVVEDTTNLVERTHASVVDRSVRRFAPFEPLATPAEAVRAVHDWSAGNVYATIRAVNRAVQRATDVATEVVVRETLGQDSVVLPELSTPLRSDAAGSLPWLLDHAEGALNGFVGDRLSARQNGLDVGLTFRDRGRVLPLDKEALAERFPEATSKLVVFVHGLSCTEWSWSLFADRYYDDPTVTFGSLLEVDLGYTPFYVRYNTGRHVSENGQLLAARLAELVAAYPREVDEIVLIGHSMGGLVARSAAHYGQRAGEAWASRLRHVFCLGSPHLGAPLEKGVNLLSGLLRAFDSAGTRVPAEILDTRSAGMKDMRFGYTLEDEWLGRDPDAVLEDNRQEMPLVDGVGYYFIAACVTRDPMHPLGQVIGDVFVRVPSAAGVAPEPARKVRFHSGRVFGGMHHFNLGSHPDVYEVIRESIEVAPGLPRLLLEEAAE